MLSETLTEAFEAVSTNPPRSVDLRRVLVRAKRRRRRRRALLTGSLAVVLAGLAIAVNGLVGGSGDRSTLTPVATPAPTLESFAGVDITVLPAGVSAVGGPDVTGPIEGNVYGLSQTFRGVKAPDRNLPPTLTITVERARPSLDAIAAPAKPNASWTNISGQRALLVSFESFNGTNYPRPSGTPTVAQTLSPSAQASIARASQPVTTLYWSPSPTSALTLRVQGQAGITLEETLAVARGIVVDPKSARAPADVTQADAQIRAAFAAAFTGGTPIPNAEAAIQGGQGLTSTLTRLKAIHPETADNTKVSVKGIDYYDAEHALVAIDLQYQFGASHSVGSFSIGALLLDGQWKVSRANYCETISLTFVNCPAS